MKKLALLFIPITTLALGAGLFSSPESVALFNAKPVVGGSSYPSNVLNGLIGWWKFDEGSGTNMAESSGSGYFWPTAYVTNSATWIAGKIGPYALEFTNNPIITSNLPLYLTSPMTYTVWLRPSLVTSVGTIWSGINANAYNYLSSGNLLSTKVNGGLSPVDMTPLSPAFYTNDWQFITFVITSSNTTKLFINTTNIWAATNSYGYSISTWKNIGASSASANPWTGWMDDMRMYNRELSTNEIIDLYLWRP